MIDVTIMLLVSALISMVVRVVIPKRELDWLSFVLGILSMCAVLIDDTFTGNGMLLVLMPAVFVTLMGGLAVMGFGRRSV